MLRNAVAPVTCIRAGRIAIGLVIGTLSATAALAQTAPAQPAAAAAPSPFVFSGDGGVIMNFVKAVMAKLKEALQKSAKPERKQQAATWKVFKSPDPAAGGNVLYVFIIDPSVKGGDYTVSTILSEAFPTEVQAIFKQYSEAYASGQNFVNLTLVADLGK